jgi:hypothetical protein
MLHYTCIACHVTDQYNLIQEGLLPYVDAERCYSLMWIRDSFFRTAFYHQPPKLNLPGKKVKETGECDFRIFPPLVNHGLVFCQQTEPYAPSHLL